MDEAYGQRYRTLYERHWWWRAREARIVELLERHAPVGGFGEILDAGCGDGLFLEGLDRFGHAWGLEVDERLVSDARRDRIHLGPLDDTYDPGVRFGLITMLDVLEHIEDDAAAVRRVFHLLEDGGLYVVTVPAYQALWTHHDTVNHHHRRYRRRQLVHTLEAAGFEVAEVGWLFRWTVPAKLAVRAKEVLLGADGGGEELPAASVNAALRAVSELEAKTWGRLPLPGSSIYAVARK